MIYLHLDPDFQPFGASIKFEAFTFSGGDPQIKNKDKFYGYQLVNVAYRIKRLNN